MHCFEFIELYEIWESIKYFLLNLFFTVYFMIKPVL